MIPSAEVVERFWSKVDKASMGGCWLWTAAAVNGYGHFCWGPHSQRRQVKAHRLAYELLVGPIPDGLTLDHLCRVTRCVNPAHLEPVTIRVNTLRGFGPSAVNARRTHCMYGHALEGDNLKLDAIGRRTCRTCQNRRTAEAERAKRRAAGAIPGKGGHNKIKTACPRGHPYTPDNVYMRPGTDWRVCRLCNRDSNRRAKAKKRLERSLAATTMKE